MNYDLPLNPDESQNLNTNPFDHFVHGLDMDGVDGISCQIVHPKISKILADLMDEGTADPNLNKTNFRSKITPMQDQIRHCLGGDLMGLIQNDFPEWFTTVDPDDLYIVLMTCMTFSWIVNKKLEAESE